MAYYQRDMLSISSRVFLAKYITEIAFSAYSLEPFRQQLANIPYFDAVSLFRYLDHDKKGFLNYRDLKKILGSSVQEKYLMHGFSRLDSLKVGELNRLQFAQFLLPKQNTQLRQIVAQRVGQPQQPNFLDLTHIGNETILQQVQVFSQMMEKIIIQEIGILTPMRKKLLGLPDYSIKGVMAALDVDRHGFVSSEDLIKFVKGQGISLGTSQKDQRNIIDLFVQIYDSNLNGKLESLELQWALEAFQSGSGKQYLSKLKSSATKTSNQNIGKHDKVKKQVLNNMQNIKNSQEKQQRKVFKNKIDHQISFQNRKEKPYEDKQNKNSASLPQEYLKSLKIYTERQKIAKIIDQELDQKEIQINKEIDSLKSEAIQSLRIKAEIQSYEKQFRVEQQLRVQRQTEIQQQIIKDREIVKKLQLSRERQYIHQYQKRERQFNLIQRQLQLQRQRQRQLVRERQIEKQVQMIIENNRILKRKLQNEKISKECQIEAQLTIQKCFRQASLRADSKNRPKRGRIYSTNFSKGNQKSNVRKIDLHFAEKNAREAQNINQYQDSILLTHVFPYPTYTRHMHPDLQQHLKMTDFYLQRSKKLREAIQKEREQERSLYSNFIARNDGIFSYSNKYQQVQKREKRQKKQEKAQESERKENADVEIQRQSPQDNNYTSPEGRDFSKGKNLPSTGRYMQSTVTRKL